MRLKAISTKLRLRPQTPEIDRALQQFDRQRAESKRKDVMYLALGLSLLGGFGLLAFWLVRALF